VAGKSISHHHRGSASQMTELRRVYRGTGIMEMDWVKGLRGNAGVTEMYRATGSLYLGGLGGDCAPSHLIIHPITHSISLIF